MKSASDLPAWVSADARSQSEVLGVVLIVGVVLVGAFVVVGLGITAISGAETQLSDDRAEKTLTQLDSKAGLVALGEADSQRVSLPSDAGEQYRVDEDAGQMWITVTNLTDESDSFEVMNESLGAVYYEREDSTVAYQGGGVWRATENGGSMISPPEFHYRNSTLTLPAVTITGDSTLGSSALIEQSGGQSKFPVLGDPDRVNPLDNHRVEVHVQSEYYMGWASYFTQRTEGEVDLDSENETVSATLVTPIDVNEITAASASLAAGGEFNVQGSAASTCTSGVYSSSYDSSEGMTYCQQYAAAGGPPGKSGDIVYGLDIDISDGAGSSTFYGNLSSGQTVTITHSQGGGQPMVHGDIEYVDDCVAPDPDKEVDCQDRIEDGSGGEARQISDIELTDPIDWFIRTVVEETAITADETNPDIDGETLGEGAYYFDSFDLGADQQLELDTSDGEVIIAVDGDATLGSNAEISITGDDHVQFYVIGDDGTDDFVMNEDARVSAVNDNATQFRMYGMSDFDATLGAGNANLAVFTGVIYAPPGSSGTGTVNLDGAEVFGGVLTGQTEIKDGPGGSIHYDEALRGTNIVPEDARVIRVTYLHVSQNEIVISG